MQQRCNKERERERERERKAGRHDRTRSVWNQWRQSNVTPWCFVPSQHLLCFFPRGVASVPISGFFPFFSSCPCVLCFAVLVCFCVWQIGSSSELHTLVPPNGDNQNKWCAKQVRKTNQRRKQKQRAKRYNWLSLRSVCCIPSRVEDRTPQNRPIDDIWKVTYFHCNVSLVAISVDDVSKNPKEEP